jgi:mono/diheme cytochrome c family protein
MKLKIVITWIFVSVLPALLSAQAFHNAPASAAALTNPFAGDASATVLGKRLFSQNCARCHDSSLQGIGRAPSLDRSGLKAAKPGEVFWLITNGDPGKGMPAWGQLSKQQRWQIVSFLESRLSLEAQSIEPKNK